MMGTPKSKHRHDPEARYSRKRIQEWVGGKVQVTETDDDGYPHLITDIAGTCSSKTDYGRCQTSRYD